MKALSITQISRMPVRQFAKLISCREVQVTRYGKAVAVIIPVAKEFQHMTVKEYLAELDRRRKAVERVFKLRDASVPKGKRKKHPPDPDWWAKIKADERRMEEEKWERIFPKRKSRVLDVAHEMTNDLRKAGVKVDASMKHDESFAEGVAERKAHPKSKSIRSRSKRTSKPKKKL
jgi:antitoxin (DNA-binding transcriptional repressor) of toxin-antitoxin stability system